METPKLTPRQRNKALSGKKKPLVTVKNILCSPYQENFWPVITPLETEMISEIFELLSPVTTFVSQHWSKLKLIPKKDRPKKQAHPARKHFLCGVNELTKSLQRQRCVALLLDASVDPRTLVRHLINAAREQDVPALCVPGLRPIVRRSLRFNSACVGIKNDRSLDEPAVRRLYEKCKAISENYPQRDGPATFTAKPLPLNETKSEVVGSNLKSNKTSVKEFEYLHRADSKRRAFVPPQIENAVQKQDSSQDFIKFKETPDPPKTPIRKSAFEPMVLKRYHSDPDRLTKRNKRVKK